MSRLQARDQLARLLTLIPWLAKNSPIALDEVAKRFEVSRKQLVRELSTVSLVGVPPYTPDTLIEVFFDDETVEVHLAQPFDRPLRLTPSEALAVFAAAQTITALPGTEPDGALQRALKKLGTALDLDHHALQVDVGHVEPELIGVLQRGIDENHSIEIDYFTVGRGQRTHRLIDPYRLVGHNGYWYLQSWCHQADGHRVFRVDRIESAVLTSQRFTAVETFTPLDEFVPSAENPLVTLELSNAAFRSIEKYPFESVKTTKDGGRLVTLRVAGEAWLARLLLSLGKDATVVTAPENLLGAHKTAAERIIYRYRGHKSKGSSE